MKKIVWCILDGTREEINRLGKILEELKKQKALDDFEFVASSKEIELLDKKDILEALNAKS